MGCPGIKGMYCDTALSQVWWVAKAPPERAGEFVLELRAYILLVYAYVCPASSAQATRAE